MPFKIRFLRSIAEVSAQSWNTLTGTAYPFLRHEFLHTLETTGCTTASTGWQALHVWVEAVEDSAPVACLPMYAKTNSMGEYVFDWSWADAYQRYGLEYYPKLVSAIPFTPCEGPRLVVAPGQDQARLMNFISDQVKSLAMSLGASSWHVLFADEAVITQLQPLGLLKRTGCQYQWFNQAYPSFDAYLATFNSRKRKNLRKEREKVRQAGIEFEILEGAQVSPEQWDSFYRFYASTYHVRGRAPYLNAAFFSRLGELIPEQLLLILAMHEGQAIAGALYFKGSDTLYGRYWGCTEEYQFLHFETCYYQGIDYCIKHGIARIDSGAQGEHKIQRGFTPVTTWSGHWIERPEFKTAIADFLVEEERHIQAYVQQAADYLPFRKDLEPQPSASLPPLQTPDSSA